MPIYEYQCTKCGHAEEVIQKISDPPMTDCPACGKKTMQKLVSAPSFRLKGGGWYETDFKSDNRKNVASSGEDKSPKKAEGGSDSKAKKQGGSTKSKKGD